MVDFAGTLESIAGGPYYEMGKAALGALGFGGEDPNKAMMDALRRAEFTEEDLRGKTSLARGQAITYDPLAVEAAKRGATTAGQEATAGLAAGTGTQAREGLIGDLQAPLAGPGVTAQEGAIDRFRTEGAGRGAQEQARLLSELRGQGPTAAQAQQQAGLDQAIRQQFALARSQPGVPAALAGRQAADIGSQMQRQAISDAAMLRAREDQARLQLRGQLAGQERAGALAATTGMAGAGQALTAQDLQRMGLLGQLSGEEAQQALARAQFGEDVYRQRLGTDLGIQGSDLAAQQALQGALLENLGMSRGLGVQSAAANLAAQGAQRGQLLGIAGGVLGSYVGGPAGGAVGSQVGQGLGNSSYRNVGTLQTQNPRLGS